MGQGVEEQQTTVEGIVEQVLVEGEQSLIEENVKGGPVTNPVLDNNQGGTDQRG